MKSLLVIDDTESYRTTMEKILAKKGYAVRTANNAFDGIGMIRDKRPDLILCDVMMPGMDGYSVLEFLKNDSEVSDIPFIFVTSLDERGDIRRGMSKGADDYLPKPFSAKELVDAVSSRLRRMELLRQPSEQLVFQEEFKQLQSRITARELQVLLLVGQGMTSRDIATHLQLRTNTVEVHRANLMRKLEAPNAASLARWVIIAEQMSLIHL